MGFGSIWHWLIVVAVIALLFGGRGKLSGIMGDFAKGIKAFKSGMKEDETADTGKPQVTSQAGNAPSTGVGSETVQKSG
jgi:sec-independent protein translocase protein TatA